MKVLRLTLKKKWFDMIASGEKKEEYREIKPYWIQRLTWHEYHKADELKLLHALANKEAFRKDFDAVEFKNGYGKDVPTILIELKGIHYGCAKEIDWIEPGYSGTWFFCLELGEILSIN